MEDKADYEEQEERAWFWTIIEWQEWAEEHDYDPNSVHFKENKHSERGYDVFVEGE
jgi:hypothetical protein